MRREQITANSWLDIGNLPDELKNVSFEKLWELRPKEKAKVNVFGEKETSRFTQSYIRDYTFSGNEAKALPLVSEYAPYLEYANNLLNEKGESYSSPYLFNQLLVNYYPNGNSNIGSHSDNENQLIPESPIVTISLGAARKFRIRDKKGEKKILKDIMTENGLVLIMGGKFQKELKHEIVKISGKLGETTGPRISITLRQFI